MHVEMITNETEFKIKKALFNNLPLKVMEAISQVPYIGNQQLAD